MLRAPSRALGSSRLCLTQCELLPSSSPCLPWGLRKTRGIQSKWSSAEGEKEPWCSQGWRDPRDAGSDTCPLLLSASPAPGNGTIPQRCCSSLMSGLGTRGTCSSQVRPGQQNPRESSAQEQKQEGQVGCSACAPERDTFNTPLLSLKGVERFEAGHVLLGGL